MKAADRARARNGVVRLFSLALAASFTTVAICACSQAPKKSKNVARTKATKARIARKTTAPSRPSTNVAQPNGSVAVGTSQTTSAPVATSPAREPASFTPAPAFTPRGFDYEAALTDIAFGSGANQNQPEPLWAAIASSHPNLFVFLGDTVKLEDRSIAEQYSKLNVIPEYRSLRETVPFLAVWNTQDYKVDSGQRDFLQQWSYLRDAVAQGQTGIYHAKIIGPKKKQVQFIVLDTRSFRGPRLADDKPNAPVLGEAQWQWLKDQIRKPADVRFIVSSIPLIPARKDGESWNNYPVERQKLFDMIKELKPRNLAVLSGGARQGSIAHTGLKGWGQLYDITTGPLNDAGDVVPEPDERMEGPTTTKENFGMAQIDWSNRLLVLKLLDPSRAILNSVSMRIH
jgi:alkaline phosphatase D